MTEDSIENKNSDKAQLSNKKVRKPLPKIKGLKNTQSMDSTKGGEAAGVQTNICMTHAPYC